MPLVAATLFNWVRRTRLSLAQWCTRPGRALVSADDADDGRIYRLTRWPDLPSASRTADVLRLLSVMSHRPVNRRWMISHSRMQAEHIDSLLRGLVARGAVEVIDASGFSPTRSQARTR